MSTTDEAKANPPADAAAAAAAAAAAVGDGAAGAYEDVEVLHKLADTLRRTMKIRNGVLQETRVDYFKGKEKGGGREGEEGGQGGRGAREGGGSPSCVHFSLPTGLGFNVLFLLLLLLLFVLSLLVVLLFLLFLSLSLWLWLRFSLPMCVFFISSSTPSLPPFLGTKLIKFLTTDLLSKADPKLPPVASEAQAIAIGNLLLKTKG